MVVGLDIGGTNLRTGAVDSDLNLTGFSRVSSREALAGPDAAQRLVAHVVAYVQTMESAPVAVSYGVPSTVDRSRRTVISTSNIPGLNNIPLAQMTEEALGVPVFVNRDTNMLLLNDIYHLGLRDAHTVIGCYPGTGFGNGIWIGGKLHIGRNGAEGELGHIPVKGNERYCGCGKQGCVEAIASGLYLEELCRERLHCNIEEVFTVHGDAPEVVEFIDNLALPVASEVNILDPDAVIIGGGVIAMPGFPRERLEERIRFHTRKPEPEASLQIHYSRPAQENGVIGAAIYGFTELHTRIAA